MRATKIKVEIIGSFTEEDSLSIERPDNGLFVLLAGSRSVATSMSARRLAEWAFNQGAREVRHEYDLRIEV